MEIKPKADREAQKLLEDNEKLREEIRKMVGETYVISEQSGKSTSKTETNSEIYTELKKSSTSKDFSLKMAYSDFEPTSSTGYLSEVPERKTSSTENGKEKLLKTETNDNDDEQSRRIVGEIAFQLDRRILQVVFAPRKRMYGFTVRNISEKINEYTTDMVDGAIDKEKRNMLRSKYDATMNLLRYTAGYNSKYHPIFAEMLVNAFGVLHAKVKDTNIKRIVTEEHLKTIILDTMGQKYTYDTMILLNSLSALAKLDGKPLFM